MGRLKGESSSMTDYTEEQKNEIEDKVLMYLDGWKTAESLNDEENGIDGNLDDDEIDNVYDDVNKQITFQGLLNHYESSLNQSLNYTGQKKESNIQDMGEQDQKMFYQAVYKLTASNLWKLYNPRINSDETEADWKDSYGGVLYIQAINELKPFKIEFNAAVYYIPDI